MKIVLDTNVLVSSLNEIGMGRSGGAGFARSVANENGEEKWMNMDVKAL